MRNFKNPFYAMTQLEVAKELKIAENSVNRIEARAIKKVIKELQQRNITKNILKD
jgi:DNA-directed RNA polymerase specialized sigma subunit